jgi:aspartate 4-decarboxylase
MEDPDGWAACRRPGDRGPAGGVAGHARRHGGRVLPRRAGAVRREDLRVRAGRLVHELTDAIIGDNYPVPDRMLVHTERIAHEYLMWAMGVTPRPAGKFELFAVEGGTAAMCYIFKSLKANRLLLPGDTIALGTPTFTPYIEMPQLEDYALNVVTIQALQEDHYQLTDAELAKLEDPRVKAFFLVNPGNPPASP